MDMKCDLPLPKLPWMKRPYSSPRGVSQMTRSFQAAGVAATPPLTSCHEMVSVVPELSVPVCTDRFIGSSASSDHRQT